MNKYTVTYRTKNGYMAVDTEKCSELNIKDFINEIFNNINEGDAFRKHDAEKDAILIKNKNRYEVIFKEDIVGFEVTQY